MAEKQDILQQVVDHYDMWTEDNTKRQTRKNGWDAVTDAYWGKLPDNWPYQSRVIDPRIRTTLIEKNARLMNNKLRGRLVPREGGDVVGARIHNQLLDFQWDNANDGGTMLEKWSISDTDTRLYGSKFALVPWRYAKNDKDEVLFDGNEFIPLDIRDCGWDASMKHVSNANWFQVRKYEILEDLEFQNDLPNGEVKYKGLADLKMAMANRSDRRDSAYQSRLLSLKGLTDRVGEDKAFPVVELVTEYRKDKWVTFAPRYKVILRDIPNPYNHGKIPVVQLRYYPLGDDPIGESEVESVLPLWKAIQAVLCGFLDEMNIKMRPPLKILDGKVRMETIQFGPEAQWLMDSPDAITEFQSNSTIINYFQTTYSSLVSAFNAAMGDMSQGISAVDPFNPDKTATEIKEKAKQQNNRDQKNQTSLAEDLQEMMSMWMSNNRQFLFMDKSKEEYVLRILGSESFEYFKRSGLDEMTVEPEALATIASIIEGQGGNLSDMDIQQMYDAGKVPLHPIIENPKEKDVNKLIIKPKLRPSQLGDSAELSVVPQDLEGNYDYVADVKSMASGASADLVQSRQNAIQMLTTNPVVLQLLQQEGFRPNVKEALVSVFEDNGYRDAERLFSKIETAPPVTAGTVPGTVNPLEQQGIPTTPQAVAPVGNQQQMG